MSTALHASPSKRKGAPVDDDYGGGDEDAGDDSDSKNGEGYNTRYKGVKRVKVHEERPESQLKRRLSRPRKSVSDGGVVVEGRKRGRPRKDASSVVGGEQIKVSSKGKGKYLENGDAVVAGEVIPSISRGRGRPRKVVTGVVSAKKPLQSSSANAAPKSKDSGREIFDGIVLVKRNKNQQEDAVGGDDHDRDGEVLNGGRGGSEDAVLAVVNGDAQGDLSSLGGSNKGDYFVNFIFYPPKRQDLV